MTRRLRQLSIAAFAAAAWCVAASTTAAQAPVPAPGAPAAAVSLVPPEGTLVPTGAAPDLDILVTGDVIGYLDACG